MATTQLLDSVASVVDDGTKRYQMAFRPVSQTIREKAKAMRAAGANADEVMAMAITMTKEFSEEYHNSI